MPVLIVSGDKDLAQLIDPQVRMLDTMKNVVTDIAGVEQKFGVPPSRIVDYLALVGDSSDNIPGIPGVGPVTAAKWLREYGSLDELVANAAAISGKIGRHFRQDRRQIASWAETITVIPATGNAGLRGISACCVRGFAASTAGHRRAADAV